MAKVRASFTCRKCQKINDQIIEERLSTVFEFVSPNRRRAVRCDACGETNMVDVLPVL